MLVSKDKGYGVVVMANSDNGQILREVIRSVARVYGWDEFLPAPYEIVAPEITGPAGSAEAKRISSETMIPFELLQAGKISEALDAYRQIKKERPANVSVSEDRLNNLGYQLMREKKLLEAIAILKLNVELYPKAWNTYDSLAEAYATNGDTELAIANYQKSLELNPANTNAAGMLKKLQPAKP